MAKFRVGDKIRLTEAGAKRLNDSWQFDKDARGNFVTGAIGIVEANEETECFGRLLVRFDGLRYPKFGDLPHADVDEGWYVDDSDVELIAPSFEPGDEVRIKSSVTDDDLRHIGIYNSSMIADMRSGDVVRESLGDFDGEPWVVLGNGFNVKNEMLELIDEPSTTPRIDVGSRVKIVNCEWGETTNHSVGTVKMLLRGSAFTHLVEFDNGDTVPFYANEIELHVEPVVVLSKPVGFAHTKEETIKRWIAEGRREVGEGDEGDWTIWSGDALVLVHPWGEAYVYRLESVSTEPAKEAQ